MTPADTTRRFVDRINAHDVPGIVAMLTSDHAFTDSLGNVFAGRPAMEQGWRAYLAMVPDYTIEVREVFQNGETVVLLGTARGTCSPDGKLRNDSRWSTPAAFRALVVNGLVAEWKVFADNEPIRRLIARGSA